MKFRETTVQKYIWEHRDSFLDMIQSPTFELKPVKDPRKYEPWELLYYHTLDNYRFNFESITDINLFGYEVHLPKQGESDIRTDLLGSLDGENGLLVCELKVNATPERQAYTELLGYANHVRGAFAPMGRQDIFCLLISPMEERITIEATLNTLVYDHNRVLVLTPEIGDTLESLQFKVWIPQKKDFRLFSKTAFAYENIDIFKICWRSVGKWSPEDKGAEPSELMIHQLNQVSAYASQLMEARGINGFVFCSQSYPPIRDAGFLENSITLCGVNPFKASKTKLLYEHGVPLKEAAHLDNEYISIFNIFPSLSKNCKDENIRNNYWANMSEVWSSCLDRIAFEVQERLTQQLGSQSVERGTGGMTWQDYLYNSSEDEGCWNYDIRLTGLLRELYDLKLQIYFDAAKDLSPDVIEYFMDEYGVSEYYIDMLNSQYDVRNFIRELVNEKDDDYYENPKDFNEIIMHPVQSIGMHPDEGEIKRIFEEEMIKTGNC